MFKLVMLLNIFVKTVILKEHYLFEIQIFCNIISLFTVTFNKCNASLLNVGINFIKFIKKAF